MNIENEKKLKDKEEEREQDKYDEKKFQDEQLGIERKNLNYKNYG